MDKMTAPKAVNALEQPASEIAEQAVLGTAMSLNASHEFNSYMVAELRSEDFFYSANRLIYQAVLRVLTDGTKVDIVSLSDDLAKHKLLSRVGGFDYLDSLISAVPYYSNYRYYIDLVKEKAKYRQLISSFQELSQHCYNEDAGISQIVELTAKRIYDISEGEGHKQFLRLGEVLQAQMVAMAQESEQSKPKSINSGFPRLDNFLGGLRKGSLIIIAARPGMGKSALALNIAQKVALYYGVPAAIFSLEMSKEELVNRIVAAEVKVNSKSVANFALNDQEMELIASNYQSLYESPIYIDDRSGISALDMLSRCRELKLKERNLGLIIVDYLQLMASNGNRGRQENRQQEISDISRSLKVMARELEVPIIALSQLSRACEARQNKRPMLSDLRDSGAIEQDADAVLFLYRDIYYKNNENGTAADSELTADCDESAAELIVAKNRHGDIGTIRLTWNPEYTLFCERADEHRVGTPPPF